MADTKRRTTSGRATNAEATVSLADARAALSEVVPNLVALVRSVRDPNVPAIGSWQVGDVVAHVSHAFRVDTDALAERPLPSVTVTAAGMAELTARWLAEDAERDPQVLADRIEESADAFDGAASRCPSTHVGWLEGVQLPPSVVACHLLEECLVHGYDIATAIGHPWPISRRHALLAVEGGALPIIAALPPTAFVDQERARSFRARFDMRFRGGGRTQLVFDDGSLILTSEEGTDVDAHVSADPAAMMLVFLGRQPMWKPVLTGKLIAWGRRPWKLAQMLAVKSSP